MLRIHFLNVGHGDCTVIAHPSGRLTMVDINTSHQYDSESLNEFLSEKALRQGNPFAAPLGSGRAGLSGLGGSIFDSAFSRALYVPDSEALAEAARELTDPIQFLQETYPAKTLWRFILTHPDLDHMRGIKRLHETIGFTNFWDTDNSRPMPNYQGEDNQEDWEFYRLLRAGAVGNRRAYTRGHAYFAFARDEQGQMGGDNMEILSPTADLVRNCNRAQKANDVSLVLRLRHGGKSVLLPGDAESDAWDGMVAHYGAALKSDFLKASHHGRDSGYHLDALKMITPLRTFVSVGRKPDTDASRKYHLQCDRVLSTRYHGDIELRIHDDGQFQLFVARNWD
jgi:competence protein ComEC